MFFVRNFWQLLIRKILVQTAIWSIYSELRTALNAHYKIHLKEFQCDLCDYRASSKPFLDDHVRQVHTLERPFKCDQCDFAASSKSTLKNHKVVHVTERKYICSTCSKSFKRLGKCYSKSFLQFTAQFCPDIPFLGEVWTTFMKVSCVVMNFAILVFGHTLVNTATNDFIQKQNWKNIFDYIPEKNHINVTNVTMHVRWQEI